MKWGSPFFIFLHHGERVSRPHSPGAALPEPAAHEGDHGCPRLVTLGTHMAKVLWPCKRVEAGCALLRGVERDGGGGPLVAGERRCLGASRFRTIPLWLQTCTSLSQTRDWLKQAPSPRTAGQQHLAPPAFFLVVLSRPTLHSTVSSPHSAGTQGRRARHPATSQDALRPWRVPSWGCSWPTGRIRGQLRGALVLPSLHSRLWAHALFLGQDGRGLAPAGTGTAGRSLATCRARPLLAPARRLASCDDDEGDGVPNLPSRAPGREARPGAGSAPAPSCSQPCAHAQARKGPFVYL